MEWQPIDTAPMDTPILISGKDWPDGKPFVCSAKKTTFFKRGLWFDPVAFGGYEWEWDFNPDNVTHWMPLPAPPNQVAHD